MRNAQIGLLNALPLVLTIIFFVGPVVCHIAFQAFNCRRFPIDLDASPAEYAYFLDEQLEIECNSDAYYANLPIAILIISVWPVGVLVFCFKLLLSLRGTVLQNRPNKLYVSAKLMFHDFKREAYWWEWCETLRKYLLTGFLLLIPEQSSFARVVVGLMFSISYLTLEMVVRPYRAPQVAVTSMALQVQMDAPTHARTHPPTRPLTHQPTHAPTHPLTHSPPQPIHAREPAQEEAARPPPPPPPTPAPPLPIGHTWPPGPTSRACPNQGNHPMNQPPD